MSGLKRVVRATIPNIERELGSQPTGQPSTARRAGLGAHGLGAHGLVARALHATAAFPNKRLASQPDADLGSTRSDAAGATGKQGLGRGIYNVSVDHLAGRSGTSSGVRHQGLAPVSGRCPAVLRLCSGRSGGAEPAVP